MKLRLFSKNSVRAGLNSLILIILVSLLGCSSSTEPSFQRENIAGAIQDICKKEYNIDVRAKLFGRTLWVYLPIEELLTKKDKPEEFPTRFEIKENDSQLKNHTLKVNYSIEAIPEKKVPQEYGYDKKALEKINNVWKVLRRVLFSMERSRESEPQFCSIVIADIKNGIVSKEVFYYRDLKKVSYGYISWDEYQHRTITESYMSPEAFGDKEGSFLIYGDITFKEFIPEQIMHRVKLKFQKPEVEISADIDKEILKLAEHTLKIYNFSDFSTLELDNLVTQNKIVLNRNAVLTGVKE